MCRLAAYYGDAISLDRLVIEPEHSLMDQSMEAHEAKLSVNGDGFGMAWYGEHAEPGVFKHTPPAWSDQNLLSLARHIRSGLILAHVRAATDGAIVQTNCHPFAYEQFSFAHNGQIGGFASLRRSLEARLSDSLYSRRQGATDSELLFLLMLTNGFADDPVAAIRTTISQVRQAAKVQGVNKAFKFTVICSNGDALITVRYSSDHKAPTLYRSRAYLSGGVVVASEPLTSKKDGWVEIKPSSIEIIDERGVRTFQIC